MQRATTLPFRRQKQSRAVSDAERKRKSRLQHREASRLENASRSKARRKDPVANTADLSRLKRRRKQKATTNAAATDVHAALTRLYGKRPPIAVSTVEFIQSQLPPSIREVVARASTLTDMQHSAPVQCAVCGIFQPTTLVPAAFLSTWYPVIRKPLAAAQQSARMYRGTLVKYYGTSSTIPTSVSVCERCQSNKPSNLAYVDFGVRESFPELSVAEILSINVVRVITNVLTLRSSAKSNVISGHTICVRQTTPADLSKLLTCVLPHLDGDKYVEILFAGDFRVLKQEAFRRVEVRAFRMVWWLAFLRKHNKKFAASTITIDISDERMREIESNFRRLVTNHEAILDDSATAVAHASVSDPSLVRTGGFDSSLVSPAAFRADTVEDVLNVGSWMPPDLNQALPNTDNLEGDEEEDSIIGTVHTTLKRQNLISDFNNTEDVFLLAFAHLFPFGEGAPTTPSECERWIKDILLFGDRRFATDHMFIFFVYDLLARWRVAKVTTATIKIDSPDVLKFVNKMNDPAFIQSVKDLQLTPQSPAAVRMRKWLERYVSFAGGSRLPWTQSERKGEYSKLLAAIHFFGLPSFFVTVNFSDTDCVIALHFADAIKPNDEPDEEPRDAFLRFDLPFPSTSTRSNVLAGNPVASVIAFETALKVVFENLLLLQDATDLKTWPLPKPGGIFGTSLGTFSVLECTGKGSLHMHGLLWTMLSPEIIAEIALSNDGVLRTALLQVIDAQVQAHLSVSTPLLVDPEEEHIEKRLRPGLWDPMNADHAFAETVAASCNMHFHCHSCGKYAFPGKTCRCRFGMPQPRCASTSFRVLELVNPGTVVAHDLSRKRRRDITNALAPQPGNPYGSVCDTPVVLQLARPTARDARLAAFSPAASAVLRCNTAMVPVGTREQGRSSVHYMVKYCTKNPTELQTCMAALYHARQKCSRFKSVAPSTSNAPAGSSHREALFLTQALLNSITGKMEIPITMCVATLLGYSSSISSFTTRYCFVWPGLGFVTDIAAGEHTIKIRSVTAQGGALPEDAQEEEFTTAFAHSSQSGRLFRDADGLLVVVPQHLDYAFRHKDLCIVSLYEFVALTDVKPCNEKATPSTLRRPRNRRFKFREAADGTRHPLHGSHDIMLRTKEWLPLIAGKPLHYPRVTASQSSCDKFGGAMVALFAEWTIDESPIFELSFAGFLAMQETYVTSPLTHLRHREQIMRNICQALVTSSASRKCANLFHRSAADIVAGSGKSSPKERDAVLTEDIVEELSHAHAVPTVSLPAEMFSVDASNANTDSSGRKKLGFVAGPNPPRNVDAGEELEHGEHDTDAPHTRAKPPPELAALSAAPVPHFSTSQNKLLCAVMNQAINIARARSRNLPAPPGQLFLVHGAAGCGKSEVLQELKRRLQSRLFCTGTTGVSAAPFGGCTVHKGFKVSSSSPSPLHSKSKQSSNDVLASQRLNAVLQQVAENIGIADIVFIDEVSMLTPALMALVHKRLQQVRAESLPWGGMCVVLAGDFLQLRPVGRSLVSACVDPTSPDDLFAESALGSATTFAMSDSFRCSGVLLDLLTNIRNSVYNINNLARCPAVLTASFMSNFTQLQPSEYGADKWKYATIITARNCVRAEINTLRAVQFATEHNSVVLCWENVLVHESRHAQWLMNEYPWAMKGYFVGGAQAMVTSNVSVANKLANGSIVKMLAVEFDCDATLKKVIRAVSRATSGDVVCVPMPVFIIVQNSDDIAFRLPVAERPEELEVGRAKVQFKSLPVDLAFALTYHKVQGATLDAVILDVDSSPLTLHHLYVGFSRVRTIDCVRLLPNSKGKNLYLLRWGAELSTFFNTLKL